MRHCRGGVFPRPRENKPSAEEARKKKLGPIKVRDQISAHGGALLGVLEAPLQRRGGEEGREISGCKRGDNSISGKPAKWLWGVWKRQCGRRGAGED